MSQERSQLFERELVNKQEYKQLVRLNDRTERDHLWRLGVAVSLLLAAITTTTAALVLAKADPLIGSPLVPLGSVLWFASAAIGLLARISMRSRRREFEDLFMQHDRDERAIKTRQQALDPDYVA